MPFCVTFPFIIYTSKSERAFYRNLLVIFLECPLGIIQSQFGEISGYTVHHHRFMKTHKRKLCEMFSSSLLGQKGVGKLFLLRYLFLSSRYSSFNSSTDEMLSPKVLKAVLYLNLWLKIWNGNFYKREGILWWRFLSTVKNYFFCYVKLDLATA